MKNIEGFEKYSVSEIGKVYRNGKELKIDTSTGYCRVIFSKDRKRYPKYLHRIVALAYIANPLNLPEVNHKDCDKLNNNVTNLEWSSHKDNIAHYYNHPKSKFKKNGWRIAGNNNESKRKAVSGMNDKGESIQFASISEAGRNGFKKANVFQSIKKGYQTKGFRFKYI